MRQKRCNSCRESKDVSCYYDHVATKDKLSTYCKECLGSRFQKNRASTMPPKFESIRDFMIFLKTRETAKSRKSTIVKS